jgi:uracil-DNA glycosylase family 4
MSRIDVDARHPVQPVVAEGVPVPGPSFFEEAERLGDPPLKIPKPRRKKGEPVVEELPPDRYWLRELMRAALYARDFPLHVEGCEAGKPAVFMRGHRWDTPHGGPQRCDVMVVGQNPGFEEMKSGSCFCGKASAPLFRALKEAQIEEDVFKDWYMTNLVRFLPPRGDKIKSSWIKDCLPLLYQELRLVRPKYLLLFGSDATKAVLGRGVQVKSMVGRVANLTVPIEEVNEEGAVVVTPHDIKVMALIHPAAISYVPEDYPELLNGIRLFQRLISEQPVDMIETDLVRRHIYTAEQLREEVDAVIADTPNGAAIAIDMEWHGRPWGKVYYPRTLQFSHRVKYGAAVVINQAGGDRTWTPVTPIVDALDGAFCRAYGNVEPTGKRWLLALDVSGSMGGGVIAGVPGLSPRVGSCAMALVTAATEQQHHFVAFTSGGWTATRAGRGQWASMGYGNGITPFNVGPSRRLDDVCRTTAALPMRGTLRPADALRTGKEDRRGRLYAGRLVDQPPG